jgi:hypothetical protein
MLAVVPVTAKVRGRDVPDGVTATSRAGTLGRTGASGAWQRYWSSARCNS